MNAEHPLGDLAAEQIENGQEALEQTTGLLAEIAEKFVNFLPTLVIALIVFVIGMIVAHFIERMVGHMLKKAKAGATAAGFGHSLVKILLYTVLIIICLSVMGVPMASIVTVVGAAGVTIGLALQNSLSNLAGGFVLLLAKPFQEGDYIITNGEEGYVQRISILYTQLQTVDHRTVCLPNSIVSGAAVQTLSKQGIVRLNIPVTVSYEADPEQAQQVLLEAAGGVKAVLTDPKPAVSVAALGESGVEMKIFVWVKTADRLAVPSAVLIAAKHALDAAGIPIPYPQQVVHIAEK